MVNGRMVRRPRTEGVTETTPFGLQNLALKNKWRKSLRPRPPYSKLLRSGNTSYRWGPEDHDPDGGSPPPQCKFNEFKKFEGPDREDDASVA